MRKLAVASLLVLLSTGCSLSQPRTTYVPVTKANTPTTTVSAEPGVAVIPKDTIPGTGLFLVGTDVQPGTYKSAGPTDEWTCYWSRYSSTETTLKATIDNARKKGPSVLVVKPTDVMIETDNCHEFKKV